MINLNLSFELIENDINRKNCQKWENFKNNLKNIQ